MIGLSSDRFAQQTRLSTNQGTRFIVVILQSVMLRWVLANQRTVQYLEILYYNIILLNIRLCMNFFG